MKKKGNVTRKNYISSEIQYHTRTCMNNKRVRSITIPETVISILFLCFSIMKKSEIRSNKVGIELFSYFT